MVYFSIMALYCCFLLSADTSEKRDNDDTFSSSEYKQPFVRCFTVSGLEIKYSSENSSCRIKWAAYSHTRGHTPTLPRYLALPRLHVYSTCRHTAPTGRSQSVCRCMDYLHPAYPHTHLTATATSSRKRALQISQT